MWKPVLAGATALVIAGSSFVLAQNRPDGARRWQPRMDDMRAFADARLAALKAGLTLTPDQEKNWPAFEEAARDYQKLRLDRLNAGIDARRSGRFRTSDPVERLQERATALSETGSALKKLADATGPLYNGLDENQKRRFAILSRLGRDGSRMHEMMDDRRGFRRGREQSFGFRTPRSGEERL